MSTTFWIIIAGAIATYLTRIGGHLVISASTTSIHASRPASTPCQRRC